MEKKVYRERDDSDDDNKRDKSDESDKNGNGDDNTLIKDFIGVFAKLVVGSLLFKDK